MRLRARSLGFETQVSHFITYEAIILSEIPFSHLKNDDDKYIHLIRLTELREGKKMERA